MIRIAAALFLIAHGLVHLLYFAPPPDDDPRYPFVPADRWFARALRLQPATAKAVARTIALACTIAFAVSGIALLVNAGLWEPTAVIGSAISVVLFLFSFHRWLVFGIAIDLAIIASALSWHVPASLFED
jgi:uncharacterized membrane protein YphA (DoxX/SURF4 family)